MGFVGESFTIDTKELNSLLTFGGVRAAKALGQALYREGALAFAASQREVPVDTGILKNSGILTRPYMDGGYLVVDISYGGAAADYALTVHEDMESRHNEGTKAKYLEDPVKRQVVGMGDRLLLQVRRGLGL
jgi:hypothetical protein